MYLRDQAIVLRSEPLREHDLFLTLFGRTQGKMLAVARGARRWQAKHAGHLDALNAIDVMLAPGPTHDVLAVARALRPRPFLRSSLSLITVAGSLADVLARLTEPRLPEPRLYEVMSEVLDLSPAQTEFSLERRSVLLSAALLKALDVLGYAPDLDQCRRCRERLAEQVFALESAPAFACAACAPVLARAGSPSRAFPFLSLRLLRFFRHRPLHDTLAVSAPAPLLRAATAFVENCLTVTPLTQAPHAPYAMVFM